jgi:putative xylitol transport system permease protein
LAETRGRPKTSGTTAKDIARRILHHESTVLALVLIALTGILSVLTDGLFTTRRNLVNIVLQSSIRGVASVGQTFVILSGGIDLSLAGVGLLVSLIGTSMLTSDLPLNIVGHPVSMYIVLPIWLVTAAGLGAVNGSLVSRIGMPSLIVTLGMWEITKGLSFVVAGGRQIAKLPESMAFFGQEYIAGVPVPSIIFIVVLVVAYFILNHTIYGRSLYAAGGNPLSAWLSGIDVKKIQLVAFTVSGLLAGLASIILTGRTMSGSMIGTEGLEIDTIASVCIGGVSLMGGRGNLIGVIFGVLIIGAINNGMSILGAAPDLQGVARGAIIISAVAIDYLRRR